MERDSAPYESIPEISFHAMAETTHPQTFHINGKVKNKDITILIDGGSTHNFVDQYVVIKIELPVVKDKSFQVMMGNKEKIECTRLCLGLNLVIQGYTVHVDFYILPVATCLIVLEV
ncbi:hypothetical protein LWI28_007868 [Acer negundo]|uniref:Uncharacterized protein n=1 Tax=Acer negundo TaxID=4023 RepID=A0AAD5P3Z4_ACENE|nr:hypothetical protein LWI28_007868 [Acer negundo]